MTFTFNIPAANNNPSSDQPLMENNFTAITNLINVDHIGFNTAPFTGQHKQVTFSNKNVPAQGSQTDPQSVLYTNNLSAGAFNTASASTVAELFYLNQSGSATTPISPFPVSIIKAFGQFDSAGNSLNTINLTATRNGGMGTYFYTMTMPSGVVNSVNYGVFVGLYANTPFTTTTAIVSATQFNIGIYNPSGVNSAIGFTVMVLQV
jgi:hypothetical protein